MNKYQKIYVYDERKFFFGLLNIDNKLSFKDTLIELRSLANIKDIDVYVFVFEFDKKIRCTIYKNRVRINLNKLKYPAIAYYRDFKEEYKEFLKKGGVRNERN